MYAPNCTDMRMAGISTARAACASVHSGGVSAACMAIAQTTCCGPHVPCEPRYVARPLEIATVDDKSNKADVEAITREMVEVADFILGPYSSSLSDVAAQITQHAGECSSRQFDSREGNFNASMLTYGRKGAAHGGCIIGVSVQSAAAYIRHPQPGLHVCQMCWKCMQTCV